MRSETIDLARGALGRRLTEAELERLSALEGPSGRLAAERARAAYSAEEQIVDGAMKAFFVRNKEFGKEHNYAHQKCRRDTLIFFRSLVLSGVTGTSEMLVTEVKTWFITILETVSVHLDETFVLWTFLGREIEGKLPADVSAALRVPLSAALACLQESMEGQTRQRLLTT